MGVKRIVFIGLAIVLALGAWAQSDSITADTAAIVLKEVEVKANKVRVYADHDEMTLSEENKKFGANAIDAISSLPAFRTQINAGEIKNLKDEPVTIIINRQVVTGAQLASYQGKEIKSVKYYPTTPGQFQGRCTGPVVEVELQRPRDAYVSLNLQNGEAFESRSQRVLDFASTFSSAGFNYMDSLNMFRLSYSFAYNNQRNMKSSITNDYGDVHNRYFSNSGKRIGQTHNLFANYQYNNPNNLFSVIVSYGKMPYRRTKMPMSQTLNDVTIDDARVTQGRREQDAVTGALFYDHTFANQGRLSVEAQGSVNWTDSRDELREIGLDGNVFNSLAHDNSRVISGTFFAGYNQPVWKGNFDVYTSMRANKIRKRYNGVLMPNADDVSASVHLSYDLKFGNLSLGVGMAYVYYLNKLSDGKKMDNHIPTPRISLGYKINDRMRVNGRFSMGTSYRTVGLMFDNKYFDSENYYQEGNFDVKACRQYYGGIDLSYYSPNGMLSAGAGASAQHNTYPFYQYVLKRGDDFVQTTLNAKNETSYNGNAYVSYRPLGWLEVYASARYTHYRNPLNPNHGTGFEAHNRVSATVQLTANYRGFYLTAFCRSTEKRYSGDQITDTPFSSQVVAAWQHRGLNVSLMWNYNSSYDTEIMKTDGFRWEQLTPRYTRNLFSIGVRYTFSHGVYKQKSTKSLSVGGESGLMRN